MSDLVADDLGAKLGADLEVKPEPEPETKPEIKPEIKPELKPETKPEPEPEVKIETKPDPAITKKLAEIEAQLKEAKGEAAKLQETLRKAKAMEILGGYNFKNPSAVLKAVGLDANLFDGHDLTPEGLETFKQSVVAIQDDYAKTTDGRRAETTPVSTATDRAERLRRKFSGQGIPEWGSQPLDKLIQY